MAELNKLVRKMQSRRLILMGDFNVYSSFMQFYKNKTPRERDILFDKFVADNSLCIMNKEESTFHRPSWFLWYHQETGLVPVLHIENEEQYHVHEAPGAMFRRTDGPREPCASLSFRYFNKYYWRSLVSIFFSYFVTYVYFCNNFFSKL